MKQTLASKLPRRHKDTKTHFTTLCLCLCGQNIKQTSFMLAFVAALLGCQDPNTLYKDHQDLEDGQWFVKNEPTFTFEIADTTQAYNVYYLVRNATGYPYYNLYMKRFLLNSENKILNEALNELILMDEKTGKPLGDGLGDLFDHKVVALKNYRFPRAGKYTFKVRQYMRQDPLLGILSVGVSVEKVPQNK